MNFSAIEQIKQCRTADELSQVWKSHIDQWSRLPREKAKALIRLKNVRKDELSKKSTEDEGYPIPDTEKEFAEDERKAIQEFDGQGDQGDNDELIRMVMDVFQGRYAQAG